MAAGNPIAAMLAQLSGGGQQQQPDLTQMLGQQVQQQQSDLQGADPSMILRQLQEWKQGMAALIPHTAFRIPGVARHLAQTLRGLDGAIKEAGNAAATAQTVAHSPIGMSAANPMQSQSGGF